MEVKFNNPFAKKRESLREAAASECKGCGATLPTMNGENTIRIWCSKPEKIKCRKLYRAKTRTRTAARHV